MASRGGEAGLCRIRWPKDHEGLIDLGETDIICERSTLKLSPIAAAPVAVICENLRTAGVQQAQKADRITFSSLDPWPGDLVCAEGRYTEGGSGAEKRAGIFIGPEFGTVARADLVRAVREAAYAAFDALVACAFNYEAHATEFNRLGRIHILKARMNADLHMAEDLKKTDTSNLFVIFCEPDIDIEPAAGPDGERKASGEGQAANVTGVHAGGKQGSKLGWMPEARARWGGVGHGPRFWSAHRPNAMRACSADRQLSDLGPTVGVCGRRLP